MVKKHKKCLVAIGALCFFIVILLIDRVRVSIGYEMTLGGAVPGTARLVEQYVRDWEQKGIWPAAGTINGGRGGPGFLASSPVTLTPLGRTATRMDRYDLPPAADGTLDVYLGPSGEIEFYYVR